MFLSKKNHKVSSFILVIMISAVAILPGSNLLAQEDEPKTQAVESPKKKRAKARGRLPNYYSKVVTPEQREKIYGIQAKYTEQLRELLAQLSKLKAAQASEVEAVLSPEQLGKVKELAAAAKEKRTAASKKLSTK